jgi:vacuolar-type H+-ATPase subunit I/STV1
MTRDVHDRRPVKTRNSAWAASAARYLRQKGYTPNTISLFSIFFALLAGLCFLTVWHSDNTLLQRGLLLFAIAGIQGRLICNLLDGMVAVEGVCAARRVLSLTNYRIAFLTACCSLARVTVWCK